MSFPFNRVSSSLTTNGPRQKSARASVTHYIVETVRPDDTVRWSGKFPSISPFSTCVPRNHAALHVTLQRMNN